MVIAWLVALIAGVLRHLFSTVHTGEESFPELPDESYPQRNRNLQTLKDRFQMRWHRLGCLSPNLPS